MENNEFELEGEGLFALDKGFTDTCIKRSICIFQLTYSGGDVVYNGIHVYPGETNLETRQEWRNSLTMLVNLNAIWVVAGHKQPFFPDDPAILIQTRKYLEDFEVLYFSKRFALIILSSMHF